LAYLCVQVIPMPESLLKFLSPTAEVMGKNSLNAADLVATSGKSDHWFALAPYYYPVRMSIIRLGIYGLFFLGMVQVLNSQRRIELAIILILITGCFEVIYGLAQTYSGQGQIFWFKKIAHIRNVTGTYINRNHFAGYMEMGLLLAALYAAGISSRKKRKKEAPGPQIGFRARLAGLFSGGERFHKRTLVLFSGILMGLGLILSASRGGIIAATGAMLGISLIFLFRKAQRRKGLIFLLLFLIAAAYALHIGIEDPASRFKDIDRDFKIRQRLSKQTVEMFSDYRLTGIGVGNFQYAYPKYQAPEDKKFLVRYSHNDWAQFLSEAGIIGFLLFLVGMFYFIIRFVRMWRRRRDPFAVCIGMVSAGVIVSMAIHSYTDFNLHLPANFLTLTALLAIGYCALYLERHRGRDRTIYRRQILALRYRGILVLCLVLGFIVWSGAWTFRHFIGEAFCNTVTNSTLKRDPLPPLVEIEAAVRWDRWNAEYWYKLSERLKDIKDAELLELATDTKYKKQRDIVKSLEQAVRLNPFKAEYHIRLGWGYVYLWHSDQLQRKWLRAADVSMKRAADVTGDNNPYLHVLMGDYWIRRSKTVDPSDPVWRRSLANARWHYQKNLSLEAGFNRKKLKERIKKSIWLHYPDESFIERIVN
jgi:O-antigen ligase